MYRTATFLMAILLLILLPMGPANAQDSAEQPVVFGVFFYSPTCPHCHIVIDDHIPEWEAEFGDQLQILYLNVQTQEGAYFIFSACDALGVPEDRCGGVPMMVIDDQVMFGSIDIPARAPQLIRDGLERGGIPVPEFGGLREAYEAAIGQQSGEGGQGTTSEEVATPAGSETAPPPVAVDAQPESATMMDRLAADPEANAIAIVVLIGLLVSLGVVWYYKASLAETRFFRPALLVIAVAGLLVAGSLVLESGEETLATLSAWGVLLLMVVTIALLVSNYAKTWLVPIVAIAGLLSAIYLAYVEVSETEAICGAIGNCNLVQQSEYARLFGILPIGVLGVIGYVAILGAWAAARLWDATHPYGRVARAALLGMALFGVAFSAYLTFLEPFVIGATCAWCITSAVLMLLLLWLVAPSGWNAYRELIGPPQKQREL